MGLWFSGGAGSLVTILVRVARPRIRIALVGLVAVRELFLSSKLGRLAHAQRWMLLDPET